MAGLLTEKIRASQQKKGLLDLWKGLLGETGLPELFSGRIGGQTLEQGIQNRLQPNSLRPALSPQQMVEAGLNIAGMAPVGATVWHGSPHKFDKFDMSKIGTGEGAQAYGHGLYMAETPEVAETYKLAGSKGEYKYAGRKIPNKNERFRSAVHQLYQSGGDKEAAKIADASVSEIIDRINYKDIEPMGALYKVDIPDESIPRMLDWDKPLSEQAPEVQAALRKADFMDESVWPHYTGRQLYEGEMNARGPYKANGFADNAAAPPVSELLKAQGIPGIRYLDGGSRTAGTGTSNFVLFDDQLPRILERNGQPTGLQPWAPGEANGLLGITPAAPARPVNHLGQPIPPTPYELAHLEAQRNAALPVEQGGLGLPAGNTAMDRARAMGYKKEFMYETKGDDPRYPGETIPALIKDGAMYPPMVKGVDINKRYAYHEMTDAMDNDFSLSKQTYGPHFHEGEVVLDKNGNLTKLTKQQVEDYDFDFTEAYPERTFFRYGSPPESGYSFNYADNTPEIGVSAYLTPHPGSLIDDTRPVYYGPGRPVGIGSDNEPVLKLTGSWKKYKGQKGTENGDIRSRFAAFDPMKRNSADLLASLAPYAAPIGAGLFGSMFLLPPED